MTIKRLLLPLLLGLLLAGPSSAIAAPGDSAPTMGDDDDDDDDDDDEDDGPIRDDEPEPEEDEAEEEEEEADEAEEEEEEADEAEEEEEEADEEAPSGPGDLVDDEDDDDDALPEIDNERVEDDESDDRARDDEPEDAAEDDDDDRNARAEAREARRRAREEGKKRLVKVIMPKAFLKYRKLELTPQVGLSNNDNFVRRLFLGLGVGFHINDVLSIEGTFAYLPNLGETDYKPLTLRFREGEEVVPDISRIVFLGVGNLALSPIFGKIELGTQRIINYDIYFTAGVGVVSSQDDMEIVSNDACLPFETRAERKANATPENGCEYVDQEHFVSNFGGGIRIVFNEWIGIRLDVRQYTHIEQVFREGEIGLEMKQNLFINIGATFFLPPGKVE